MTKRECKGCGCFFHPFQQDGTEDLKCPYCGGGRGRVLQTPLQRIQTLEKGLEDLKEREMNYCDICSKYAHCFLVLGKLYCEKCNEEGCLENIKKIKDLKKKLKDLTGKNKPKG